MKLLKEPCGIKNRVRKKSVHICQLNIKTKLRFCQLPLFKIRLEMIVKVYLNVSIFVKTVTCFILLKTWVRISEIKKKRYKHLENSDFEAIFEGVN